MLHGKQKSEWAHTSALCSVIANSAPRGKKGRKKQYKPADFSPYKTRAGQMSFKNLLKVMAQDTKKAKVIDGRSK